MDKWKKRYIWSLIIGFILTVSGWSMWAWQWELMQGYRSASRCYKFQAEFWKKEYIDLLRSTQEEK